MNARKASLAATGVLTFVLVLGGIGHAYGESAEEATPPLGWLGEAAARTGGGLADIVADLTGLEIGDVVDRRRDGESFAAIAEERLQTAVDNGRIDEDRADEIGAELRERLEELVESTEWPPFDGGHGPGGPGGAPDVETDGDA